MQLQHSASDTTLPNYPCSVPFLRDDFTPESDIDVLVEFGLGKTPGLTIVTMQQELSAICNGRTIDLHTPQELSRYFRDRVLTETLVQYVKD